MPRWAIQYHDSCRRPAQFFSGSPVVLHNAVPAVLLLSFLGLLSFLMLPLPVTCAAADPLSLSLNRGTLYALIIYGTSAPHFLRPLCRF